MLACVCVCPFTQVAAEVGSTAAVLGFVGAPFTLATYIVEGGSSQNFAHVKRLAFGQPAVLHALLDKLADNVADYCRYQVRVCVYVCVCVTLTRACYAHIVKSLTNSIRLCFPGL